MCDHEQHLIENAIQNYVSGRFAFFARLQPTGAILFHRAIEFLLKGALLHHGGKPERGHDIERLWADLKTLLGRDFGPALDLAVSDLNKFETLRYPERSAGILQEGMTGLYTFRRGEGGFQVLWGRPPPAYELYLTEVDDLFGAIWLTTTINSDFFTATLTEDAKTCLERENLAAPFGKPR